VARHRAIGALERGRSASAGSSSTFTSARTSLLETSRERA
jgi:hypothetical protein